MLSKYVARIAFEGIPSFSSKKCFSKKTFHPCDLQGKLNVVGVPFGKGQKKKGKDEVGLKIAPDCIRGTGIIRLLENLGLEVCDLGNIGYEPLAEAIVHNMNNLDHCAPCMKAVSNTVQSVLQDGKSCLVLGGDHSIATGSIYGHMSVAGMSTSVFFDGSNKIAVFYIDAHTDINTNATSPSGNIHGMTLALLASELQGYWPEGGVPGLDWLYPCLPLSSVAYIGTRSVDNGESNFLCKNNVAVFSMEDIDKYGLHKVLCKALGKIDPSGNKSIHISFDIDALDYFEAPCTTVPVRGGLTLREGIEIAETLHKTGRVSVVDLVEVNPAICSEAQKCVTLEAAKHILLAMYGHSRRGNNYSAGPCYNSME